MKISAEDMAEYNRTRRLFVKNRQALKFLESREESRKIKKDATSVDVGPGTSWANPWTPGPEIKLESLYIPAITPRMAYLLFYQRWQKSLEQWPVLYERLDELRGKELLCSCSFGEDCHAKVLKILANGKRPKPLRSKRETA